ncbi:MAG: type II toxin-antitoxin system HicA family toxin [Burkholderiales bacterium]|nr:type II toxin-antitoxin system HicA family toxin [Burkholderiales bacterium]
MNRPRLYSSDETIKALERGGFEQVKKSRGSHLSLRKKIGNRTVVTVVPMGKKEIPRGTFANILKLAEVSLEEFQEWL